jgi:GT2 family glycosyltransferase
MYFEDVDLCKRVRLLNKKILVFPAVKVMHLGGKSSASKKNQKQFYYTSQDYYFKKYFGSFQLCLLRLLRKLSLLFQ